jgi:hypothetical protein
MSNYVLFQMWGPFRQSLIKSHLFYFEEAQKRLLSQFDNIETEADRAADEWLKLNESRFSPERHDPAEFYEAAHDASIEFYGLLSDMRDTTTQSVVAGMFHQWDKQFRDWLVREIQHWHSGPNTAQKVWSVDFVQIAELLECLGWNVKAKPYFKVLDACRLVVNVYKHGEGKSLADLKRDFPAYLREPFGAFDIASIDFIDHTHLSVNNEQLKEFSDAIVAFWQDVPENTFQSSVKSAPSWFEKAMTKDLAEGRGRITTASSTEVRV